MSAKFTTLKEGLEGATELMLIAKTAQKNGDFKTALENYELAMPLLEDALKNKKTEVKAKTLLLENLMVLGELYKQEGELEEAISAYERAKALGHPGAQRKLRALKEGEISPISPKTPKPSKTNKSPAREEVTSLSPSFVTTEITKVGGNLITLSNISTEGGDFNFIGGDTYYDQYIQKSNSLLSKYKAGKAISWGVPLSLDYFVDRPVLKEALQNIHKAESSICACMGMGGTGKTQFTLNYVQNASYTLKAWFQAENTSILEQGYIDFAKALGLEEDKPTKAQAIAYLKNKLAEQSDWLLVFDNVENLASVEEFLIEGGHILISTCWQSWPFKIKSLLIEAMRPEEGLSLLEKSSGISKDPQAFELLKTLAYFPLAIAQAGAYLRETSSSISSYLELYAKQPMLLLGDSSLGLKTVAQTLSLSIAKLEESALALLRVCAYLDADNIPVPLLYRCYQSLYPDLESPEYSFQKSMASLSNLSLVHRTGERLNIHRLVQIILHHQDQTNKAYMVPWYSLLEAIGDEFNLKSTVLEDMVRQKALLPHLKSLKGHYASLKEDSLESQLYLAREYYSPISYVEDYSKAKSYILRLASL